MWSISGTYRPPNIYGSAKGSGRRPRRGRCNERRCSSTAELLQVGEIDAILGYRSSLPHNEVTAARDTRGSFNLRESAGEAASPGLLRREATEVRPPGAGPIGSTDTAECIFVRFDSILRPSRALHSLRRVSPRAYRISLAATEGAFA